MTPRDFRLRSFEDLFAIPLRNGLNRPKSSRGAGIKMVNMGELFAHDRIGDLPMERVSVSEGEMDRYLLEEGDLLFARQSLKRSGAGKCSLVLAGEPRTYEGHLIRVRLNSSLADPAYYFYFFQSPFGRSLVQGIVEQVAAAGIRGSDLRRLKIPHPPLTLQKVIGRFLGLLDDKVNLNGQLNHTLDEMVKVIFRSASQDSPRGSVTSSLGTQCDIVRGRSYRSEQLTGDETALVSLKSFERGGGYRKDGLKPYSGPYSAEQVIKPGEVVVACTDVTQAAEVVGRAARIPDLSFQRTLVPSLDAVIIRPRGGLANEFVYCLLREQRFARYCYAHTSGTTVLHLDRKALPKYQFIVPSLETLETFQKDVGPIFQLMDSNERESETLIELRNLLLPKLISGEIRIRDTLASVGAKV